MRIYIIIAALIWLLLSWFSNSVGLKAEEITTGNLLTNGNFETGNANGWTTEGDVQVLNDCCTLNNVASNYDLEFGDSGSISQDVNLTTDTITQEMLDNGITLTQVTEVQNGECSVSGCWGGQGGADTFTITLNIKDNDGNVIATMTSTRTDTTGINGANFTDRLIYTGTGSNVGNTNISAIDANAPANLGGPNVDNIYLSMTFDNTVLEDDTIEDLREFEEQKVELPPEQPYMMPEFETIAPPPLPEETTPIALPPTMKVKKEPEVVKAQVKTEVKKEKEPEKMASKIIEQTEEEEKPSVQEETKTEKKSEAKAEEKKEETKVTAKPSKKNINKKKLSANIDKVMAQVDSKIKDAAKNLEVKSIIKLKAMEGEVSLAAYKNQKFYKSKDIYLGNNLIDNRDIYSNVTLASYIANDPVNKKDLIIQNIKKKKQRLLLELKELKNNG